jgi:hypothetical protein
MNATGALVTEGLVTGIEIGKELGLWKQLASHFRRRRKILVLGASGAGKTQFINSIEKPLAQRLSQSERTVGVEKRKAVIDGYPIRFFDTPGQILDQAKRAEALKMAVRKSVSGIINIVSYGYHEAAEADKAAATPEKPMEVANPLYLADRRQVDFHFDIGAVRRRNPLLVSVESPTRAGGNSV